MVEEMKKTNPGSRVKRRHKGSSSIKKASLSTNHNPDLISALPDSLLLHILSFLNMEDVMETSLLSRRWRYLWKSIPCLCFELLERYPRRFDLTNFIDRCLFHHEGSKIHKLHINFMYLLVDSPAHLVDSWIHFAIKCRVEDFKLHLNGEACLDEPFADLDHYKVPCSLYNCGTLTSLTLCVCDLNLPHSFQLGSLKRLSLQYIELSSDSIEHLSSSCPLLEDIYLLDCNRETDLNITIINQHVKRFEISEFTPYESATGRTVKINAPTLVSLGIYQCCPSVWFHIEELGSLMSADIINRGAYSYVHDNIYLDEPDGNYLAELVSHLGHVQHLKLCCSCMQVLSVRSLQSLDLLSISATCIELKFEWTKWKLPGIIYLLQSCSNLEKLKIVNNDSYDEIELSDEFIDEHDFEEKEYWESFETNIPPIMQKIKFIEINGLGDNVDEEFVGFLLKNAKVLEKMVINTFKKYASNFKLLFELTQRLTVFPRSSPNAKLFITKLSTLDS